MFLKGLRGETPLKPLSSYRSFGHLSFPIGIYCLSATANPTTAEIFVRRLIPTTIIQCGSALFGMFDFPVILFH